MEDKLITYLDEIVEALRKGIDFAGEQAPLFVQEYLSYATYFHWSMVALSILIFAALGLGIRATYNKFKEQGSWEDWELGVAFFSFMSCFPLAFLFYHVLQLIKITIAPRVYLVEQISTLI